MSKIAEMLFGGMAGLKEAALTVAPGLANVLPDVAAELGRQGTRGTMELASALFSGQAYVQYGPSNSIEATHEQAPVPSAEQEHAGMER